MNKSNKKLNKKTLKNVADNCLCFYTRRITKLLTRLYDDALVPSNLTVTQFNILTALGLADSMSLDELANIQGSNHSTISRVMSILEQNKLVSIQKGKDLRRRLCTLTPFGQNRLRRALPLWQRVQNNLYKKMKRGDLLEVLKNSEKLITNNK